MTTRGPPNTPCRPMSAPPTSCPYTTVFPPPYGSAGNGHHPHFPQLPPQGCPSVVGSQHERTCLGARSPVPPLTQITLPHFPPLTPNLRHSHSCTLPGTLCPDFQADSPCLRQTAAPVSALVGACQPTRQLVDESGEQTGLSLNWFLSSRELDPWVP